MKRKLALFLAICILATLCVTPVFAVSPAKTLPCPEGGTIIHVDSGYLVTSVIQNNELLRSTDRNLKRTTTYYNDKGVAQCALTVYGTFRYDGTWSQCLNNSYSFTAYDNAWSIQDVLVYGSNGSTASATATGVFVKKILGIPITKIETSAVIHCDANGNAW